jgi:hypothetical protein
VSDAIIKFVTSQHYSVRGGTFVNTIFIADELIAANAPSIPAPGTTTAASAAPSASAAPTPSANPAK